MTAYVDDVAIMLLPNNAVGEQHSTLCYAGAVYNAPPATVLCERTQLLAKMWFTPPVARVVEHRLMGPKLVPCAIIDGVELYALHDFVEEFAYSQWGYVPHIAEQESAPLIPIGHEVVFNRIALWYGVQHWAWRFGSGVLCAS